MFRRSAQPHIVRLAKGYPIVAITGPRQSGKTTLAKELFAASHRYVSLEDPDTRLFAQEDPRGFLSEYNGNVIFDEMQHVPTLFSYLQTSVDENGAPGRFIITGSHNFLLLEQISQTLAGRCGIVHLLPFELGEVVEGGATFSSLEEALFKGAYPRLYTTPIQPTDWYRDYIQTYVERDVRSIRHVQDLSAFQQFLRVIAGRVGQVLDLTSIGNDCGLTHTTVKSWIGLLEASFIIFLLRPHHAHFRKRLIKRPKLYFYDTGLLSSLLGMTEPSQLVSHYLRGSIFESFVISDLMKRRSHTLSHSTFSFWRDSKGVEVDCLIENDGSVIPIEIKSAKTINASFFDGLREWMHLANEAERPFLVYGGEAGQQRTVARVVGWRDIGSIPI
jgi:hypothetical protein